MKPYTRAKATGATRFPGGSLGAEGSGLGWDLNAAGIFAMRQYRSFRRKGHQAVCPGRGQAGGDRPSLEVRVRALEVGPK